MFGSETCEICPKVLRNVYVKFTESSKPVQEDPYGPTYGPIRAHIGAHKGPNPDRAPTRPGALRPALTSLEPGVVDDT